MTRVNRIVAGASLGACLAFVGLAVAVDVWIYDALPEGSTISWSIELLFYRYPIVAVSVGYLPAP